MIHLPDFLVDSDGEIRLKDHRIGIYHLIQNYNEGKSAEMLSSRYPTLPLPLVHKVIAFYLENQGEVDSYLARCSQLLADQQIATQPLNLSALRQRLAATHPTSAATYVA